LRTRDAWIVGGACAALLGALLLFRMFDPWRFPNDDNGAWFSAVARSHLNAGLRATRGQDFFTSRDTGELVPYLHHPPLPGLVLAAVFGMTGSQSPGTARLTFAVIHLVSFALIAHLAAKAWDPATQARLFAWVLAVAATVPMSAYYGKMPNHEVPGLLFFLLGVAAWGFRSGPSSARRVILACVAWAGAAFSSWHAVLCVLGWLAVQRGPMQRRRVVAALLGVVASTALVLVHLFWAGGWVLHDSQSKSAGYWFAGSDGASLGDRLGFWNHALGIGINNFAQFPALLSILWLLALALDRVRGRGSIEPLERNVLGLGLGSMAYFLLFPRAVSFHGYQAFYLIPFVALSSSLALRRLGHLPFVAARARLGRALPVILLGLTCVVGVATTVLMYRKPSPGALKTVQALERQYR
jgi:hypothetical protein